MISIASLLLRYHQKILRFQHTLVSRINLSKMAGTHPFLLLGQSVLCQVAQIISLFSAIFVCTFARFQDRAAIVTAVVGVG